MGVRGSDRLARFQNFVSGVRRSDGWARVKDLVVGIKVLTFPLLFEIYW